MKRTTVAGSVALLLFARGVLGQTLGAGLTGSVADPDGLPVPRADVVAIDARTNALYATRSDEVGFFSIAGLPAGRYVLRVEREGFKTLLTSPLALEPGRTVHAPLRLDVGRVEERVVVEYRLPTLQTESAVVGDVVTGRTAAALPLAGRSIAQLALLLPGSVSTAPASMAQPKLTALGRPYVNGHREQGSIFVLDGMDVTEPADNLWPYQPSPEALEEVRIETNNYSSAQGNLAGAVIHATVKSGTNRLRGSVFELMRDDRLNANSWEENRAQVRRGPLWQHTFGGVLGGPLLKDKLFFFADYQGLLRDVRAGTTFSVAPAAWRAGDFSDLLGSGTVIRDPVTGLPFPGNLVPQERIHPVARALMEDPALYPLPDRPEAVAGNLSSESVGRTRSHQGDLKLTFHATPRDSGSLRFSYQHFELSCSTPAWPSLPTCVERGPFANGVLNWNRHFGVGGLSESSVGYARVVYNSAELEAEGRAGNAALGLDDNPSIPGLSAFNLSGLSSIGSPGLESENTGEIYHASERLSLRRGRHQLNAGAQWLHSRVRYRYSGNHGFRGHYDFTGAFSGLGFSDFLLGLVAAKGRAVQAEPWQQLQHRVGLFVEDSFKARPNLTLISGLRWSFFSPLVEARDRQVNFDLASGHPLRAGQEGNGRALYDAFYGGFEPRLGIAWVPRERLAVRAGYGLVQSMEGTGANLRLAHNPPFFVESWAGYDATTAPGRLGFSDLRSPAEFSGSLRIYDPRLKPQLTQQWNLFFEYALTRSLTVNVGYVGHKATRVVVPRDYNQPLPGQGAPETWAPLQQRRPLYGVLPDVTAVSGTASEGNSNYNGLQVIVRQRPARGIEFLASYTWSKAMSDNIGYYGGGWSQVALPGFYQQNAYDREADYGPAFFDVTHNFVLSGTYDLPERLLPGVQLGSILTARTGFPITVIDSRGRSLQGSRGFERPDRVGSGRVPKPTLDRWIDATAFTPAAAGAFGNSGVGILRAPGYFMWDLALSRSFGLGAQRQLILKLQAFNVLNHPNFGPPSRDLADPVGFGSVTNTVDLPRRIELGVKLEF